MNTQGRTRYTRESAAERYIEEGTAFIDLCGATAAALMKGDVPIGREIRPLTGALRPERFTVIVIGGGQAGLSVGYHLHRRGISFVILDQNRRIGDSWRKRWDSLRLFTPAGYDGLAGMPFLGSRHVFPTKPAGTSRGPVLFPPSADQGYADGP